MTDKVLFRIETTRDRREGDYVEVCGSYFFEDASLLTVASGEDEAEASVYVTESEAGAIYDALLAAMGRELVPVEDDLAAFAVHLGIAADLDAGLALAAEFLSHDGTPEPTADPVVAP